MSQHASAPAPPLRFGAVVDGDFTWWQTRCLTQLADVASLQLVVTVQPIRLTAKGGLGDVLMRRLFGRPTVRESSGGQVFPSPNATATFEFHRGAKDYGELATVIRHHELDFVLDFVRLSDGEILAKATRYGIWHFRFGEVSGPQTAPGLNEILDGIDTTAIALEGLNVAGRPILLYEGLLRTVSDSLRHNRDQALRVATDLPARAAGLIAAGRFPEVVEVESGVPHRGPNSRVVARLLWKLTVNRARRRIKSLYRHATWNVGWVDRPISTFLTSNTADDAHWLEPLGQRRFLADPFPLSPSSPPSILAEVYDRWSGRGSIGAVDGSAGSDSVQLLPIETQSPPHASYPYTFRHEGHLYCVPELHQLRKVRLYRVDGQPVRWQVVRDLLDDVAAVDPTIFRHDDRWWLLYTDADVDADASLWAWHSDALDGEWHPHAGNPVKTDVRSSRPAGTPFVHDGELYRPAQDGSRAYGGAVVVNLVKRLTPTEFEEEAAVTVEPDPYGPYPHGLHTLAASGDVTLLDGKRLRFVPAAFAGKLRRRIAGHSTSSHGSATSSK